MAPSLKSVWSLLCTCWIVAWWLTMNDKPSSRLPLVTISTTVTDPFNLRSFGNNASRSPLLRNGGPVAGLVLVRSVTTKQHERSSGNKPRQRMVAAAAIVLRIVILVTIMTVATIATTEMTPGIINTKNIRWALAYNLNGGLPLCTLNESGPIKPSPLASFFYNDP